MKISWTDCAKCEVVQRVKEERNILPTIKRSNGLVLHSNRLVKHIIEGQIKGREDEEKCVSSYWMTSRERECTGILKRKH
jgi:hypothetical protein